MLRDSFNGLVSPLTKFRCHIYRQQLFVGGVGHDEVLVADPFCSPVVDYDQPAVLCAKDGQFKPINTDFNAAPERWHRVLRVIAGIATVSGNAVVQEWASFRFAAE